MNRRTLMVAALLSATLSSTATLAQGQNFPDKPLQLIVPFAPGGNADIVARVIAQGLSDELGQPVLVVNKAGANAAIGAEFVARAAPNGLTLLFATAESHALNPHLRKSLPYDALNDFVSIGIVDRFPLSLVVNPSLPSGSLTEFVAHAKRNDGKLNFASWGNGSTSQIAFEQIKQVAGIRLEHVPFQGAAPAITAVAAGDVQAFVVPLSVALPHASAGRVKVLAVMSAAREPAAPTIPTATEQGLPVVISGWHVLAAPAGTPAPVLARLNAALNAVNAKADIRDKLGRAGVQPATSTLEEVAQMVRSEHRRWGEVARKAGLEPQ
jgi:tripartite-type tricarboxylate transporter receptor subunit TctC